MSLLIRAFDKTHYISSNTVPATTQLGQLWSKTSTSELYLCTSLTPVTYVLLASGVAGGYTSIAEEGVTVAQRSALNFVSRNVAAVDDPGNSRTNVTLTETPQFDRLGLGVAAPTGAVMVADGQYYSDLHDAGDVTGAVTVNWANGNVQRLRLTGAVTLTFSNPKPGARYLLALVQDAVGSRLVNWPAIRWVGGTAPTLTTTANKIDLVTLVYVGGEFIGGSSGNA
jgi:hypothetical protein